MNQHNHKPHPISIPEKYARRAGITDGQLSKAISEGPSTRGSVRDNLMVVFGTTSFPLTAAEYGNIQPGDDVEAKIEKKEMILSEAVIATYNLADGASYTVHIDKHATGGYDRYVSTSNGKVYLFNLTSFSSNYSDGDIVHIVSHTTVLTRKR